MTIARFLDIDHRHIDLKGVDKNFHELKTKCVLKASLKSELTAKLIYLRLAKKGEHTRSYLCMQKVSQA